jgi:hypothetical protein
MEYWAKGKAKNNTNEAKRGNWKKGGSKTVKVDLRRLLWLEQ